MPYIPIQGGHTAIAMLFSRTGSISIRRTTPAAKQRSVNGSLHLLLSGFVPKNHGGRCDGEPDHECEKEIRRYVHTALEHADSNKRTFRITAVSNTTQLRVSP